LLQRIERQEVRHEFPRVPAETGVERGKPTIDSDERFLWHDDPMRVAEVLARRDIPQADSEILLSFALRKDRTWVLAHTELELTEIQLADVQSLIDRRLQGEPIAYITGEKEFYGRMFTVTSDVLIPRPATEGLIDAFMQFRRDRTQRMFQIDSGIVALSLLFRKEGDANLAVVDIGTGSGCIAVTLAHLFPNAEIIATDVSDAALSTAKSNAKKHHVSDRIDFCKGSLLTPINDVKSPFLIISNPPYIPVGTPLARDVSDFEPSGALFAGSDGMDVLVPLFTEAKEHPLCEGITVECREEQANALLARFL
jgi:release factor glutamine methyltransferase